MTEAGYGLKNIFKLQKGREITRKKKNPRERRREKEWERGKENVTEKWSSNEEEKNPKKKVTRIPRKRINNFSFLLLFALDLERRGETTRQEQKERKRDRDSVTRRKEIVHSTKPILGQIQDRERLSLFHPSVVYSLSLSLSLLHFI